MGKYNHISELTGAENYPQWSWQMILVLQGKRLWPHCSNGTDPTDFANYASTKPVPKDLNTITTTEQESILNWLAKNAQAKALINRKISITITTLLNVSQSAWEQWEILSSHYSCNDLLLQYELRKHIHIEKLKDVEDITHYIGIFEDARCCFTQMGVIYTTKESIFDLLQDLPQGVE